MSWAFELKAFWTRGTDWLTADNSGIGRFSRRGMRTYAGTEYLGAYTGDFMPTRPTHIDRSSVSGRLITAGLFTGILVILLILSSRAQGDDSPDVNQVSADQEPSTESTAPVSAADPPDGYAWTTNGELIPIEAVGSRADGLEPGIGAAVAAGRGRLYYLTEANFSTSQALTACAAGYHMASMWEIIDPSNLTYDYTNPAAHTKADSGQGPPSLWYGWVRTGGDSSGSGTAGTGNCNNWTSNSNAVSGVSVRLSRTWETPPNEIGGIWDATSFTCNFTGPVWCARD